ncbi:hypothetical protein [Bradyrhizobium cenepequi]|uniref:hypothetical protein n=1 Tax=Bradyrhizobium cenepequi TaxID=2821403 RepID=UPI001CE33D31|nr:hypothetical protein [Bradyrhizobium cenepequi]MCA6113112.1 hypothetical protein [Bradyrhizobium cenepequi]
MQHDATAKLYFGRSVFFDYLDYAFGALVDGAVVGRAFGVPFAFNVEGRTELPDGGWDQVIRWAHEDRLVGRSPTTMCALEITLVPKTRGTGNAVAMLDALKACAKKMDFAEMFAPVRPSQKQLGSRMPMREYVELRRADGLPIDAWLRTHVSIGGRIMKIAPYSMTIVGTIAEWSQWTGAAFERSGTAEVEGALVPVLVSVEQNYGVYVEPNVWVRHPL